MGDKADVVAARVNSDPGYVARVAKFALDGSTQQVQPVSSDLTRLVPSPVHMIADLRGLLAGQHGFKAEQFDSLAVLRPPMGNFPVAPPVAYLETLEATMRFYWEICKRRYPATYQWPDLKLGAKNLQVWSPPDGKKADKKIEWPAGTVHMVGLDLLAYYDPKDGTTVEENRAKEQAGMPGVEILALMALAPALGQAMDGGTANGGIMPWLFLPGLEANVSGYGPWTFSPIVGFDRDDRGLGRSGRYSSGQYVLYASPAFRECQG